MSQSLTPNPLGPNCSESIETIHDYNVLVIEQLTTGLALETKGNFDNLLKEKFPDKQHLIIKEKTVDKFGRTTFFHVLLGQLRIPLYQPATIMFRSAMK